jgi:hypothetical protein
VHFAVPWSRASETSFLVTSDAMKSALEQTGARSWPGTTAPRRPSTGSPSKQKARAAAQAGAFPSPPPLGLHVAIGTDFPALSANLDRILREGRVAILQAVLHRPLLIIKSVRRA